MSEAAVKFSTAPSGVCGQTSARDEDPAFVDWLERITDEHGGTEVFVTDKKDGKRYQLVDARVTGGTVGTRIPGGSFFELHIEYKEAKPAE